MLLKPLVIRRPLPHEHAERRRLRRVRRRREVAEVALLAGRDRRVALRARPMKSVLCAAIPMLWNFWSEKSGLTVLKAWQLLQRPLPLKRPQPRRAESSIAFSSPATKRSNGASPAYCVRSNAAIAL